MNTIDITTILGTELKSRTSARDFATYLNNMNVKEACVDFSRVNSVTRSFMDEFYQLFIKPDKTQFLIHLSGMNQQTEVFLKTVEHTSERRHSYENTSGACFISISNEQQLNEYLASIK